MRESIVFVVRVRCRRRKSSRSLSHLLVSSLFIIATALPPPTSQTEILNHIELTTSERVPIEIKASEHQNPKYY